jgi:hypothetical protein
MNAVLDRPASLSVALVMTDDIKAKLQEGEGALAGVKGYEIANHDTAAAVAGEMNGYKRAIVKLEDLRKGFLRPAQEIIDNAKALFNPAIDGFKAAEAHCKTLLAGWDDKERKRIALENALREEAARKIRQEAEREAAVVRARADEAAAEARRKSEEAEAARRKALAEGNARAAATAAAEKAKQDERERAARENGEAKAQEALLAAAAQVAAAPVVEQAKVAGASMRDKWVAKILVTDMEAKRLIVAAAAGVAIVDGKRTLVSPRPELLGVLDLGGPAIRKQAESLHEAFNIPGFEAVNEPIVAGSRK